MSVFWNKRVCQIEPYIPGEQPRETKIIKLNTNENPYPPSPLVYEAMHSAINDRLRLYPDPACTELREAIAQKYHVRTEEVFAGNSSDEILAFVFGAFFESGGAARPVLFPDISYSFYPVFAKLWDIPCREIPLDSSWQINIDDYLVQCGGVIFPNPNAPTGCAVTEQDVKKIIHWHRTYNTVVVVDKAYSAFCGNDTQIPPAEHDNLLSVYTYSKAYSLAGMRIGYAIGSAELIAALERIRDSFNSYTVDRAAQAAARAAILDHAYYDMITQKIIATRERTAETLHRAGFTVLPSSANFLFIKHPALAGAEFFTLLRRQGILARHFGKERIKDYLRVTIGTDSEMDIFLAACRT